MKTTYIFPLFALALLAGTSLSTSAQAQNATVNSQGNIVAQKNADGTSPINRESTVPGSNYGNSLTRGDLKTDLDSGYKGTNQSNLARKNVTPNTNVRTPSGETVGTASNVNGVRGTVAQPSTSSNIAGQRVVGSYGAGAMNSSTSTTSDTSARLNTDINAGATGAVINNGVTPSAETSSASGTVGASGQLNGSDPTSTGGAFGGTPNASTIGGAATTTSPTSTGGAMGGSASSTGSVGASNGGGAFGAGASVGTGANTSSGSTGSTSGGSSSSSGSAGGSAGGGSTGGGK